MKCTQFGIDSEQYDVFVQKSIKIKMYNLSENVNQREIFQPLFTVRYNSMTIIFIGHDNVTNMRNSLYSHPNTHSYIHTDKSNR